MTSNFVTHLKRKHPSEYDNYVKKRKTESSVKRVESKQELFNEDILNFVVQTASPLSIVDNLYFRRMFEHRVGLKIPSRRVISDNLHKRFDKIKSNIKKSMNGSKYFSTTADIWSNKHKSFFGYTCHWLNNDFKRMSAALACKRFTGSHTFDRIADLIQQINDEFELSPFNIVATITDNGSNFAKAFKEYGVNAYKLDETHQLIESDNDSSESDELDEYEEIEFSNLGAKETCLPKHYRCGSHTINLVASTDFNGAIKADKNSYSTHLQVFLLNNVLSGQTKLKKNRKMKINCKNH